MVSTRIVRHIGGRAVQSTDALPLAIIPYGAGEALRHLRIDAYAGTVAANTANEPPEINWIGIDVPWAIALTHATAAGQGGTGSLDTASEWDTIFRNLVLEYGTDGNEYYGGDYDQSGGADTPPTPGEAGSGTEPGDAPAIERSMGPSGVVRLFGREVFMRPLLAEGSGEVRWFDEFNLALPGRSIRESGGVVMLGVVRYETPAETNFGVEFTTEGAKGLSALIGGDMQRIQEMILSNTAEAGDRLRTLMFGGDNYIEADTIKEVDAKCAMKVWASFTTPYRMGVV